MKLNKWLLKYGKIYLWVFHLVFSIYYLDGIKPLTVDNKHIHMYSYILMNALLDIPGF